jgi:hypothetical protein
MAAAAASLHTGNTGERERPGQDVRRRWGFEAHPKLVGGLWPAPPLLSAPAAVVCRDGRSWTRFRHAGVRIGRAWPFRS